MDSLYGGKQGIDFVLRGSFSSITAMVQAFKGGPQYTDIWYNEYCIIDTPNKNSADNGKVYRRGLDYQNSMGGAIYIGQIVGPSSGTPYFQLVSIDDVIQKSEKQLGEYEYRSYPYGYDEENQEFFTTDGTKRDENDTGSSSLDIKTFEFSTDYDNTLVPGKYVEADGTVKYNDSILYTWCNIREDGADSDSWFYVGWQQPYLVLDFIAYQTSPYDEDGMLKENAVEIEQTDFEEDHPFYNEWNIGIPKGIKGDTLRNLRVITPTEQNRSNIYNYTALQIDSVTGEATFGSAGYPGIDDDITNQRQILVFDYYVYDKELTPTPYIIYLGDFNVIESVNVDDDGTITISFSHDSSSVFEKKIRWVDNVQLTEDNGSAGGQFVITFNNDNPELTKTFEISWIKSIEIEEDGTLVYTYAGTPSSLPANATGLPEEGVYRVEDFLEWINAVELNSNNGHFSVTNNRNEIMFETDLDWIKDIYINEESGAIYIQHTNPALNQTYDDYTGELLDAKLRLVVGARVNEDGTISFITNTGESYILQEEGNSNPFKFKYIKDVILNTGIYQDKRIQIQFNTDIEPTPIGDPINFIQDMVVRESDWHLLVLYSDPEQRATAEDLDEQGKDAYGVQWYNNVLGSNGNTAYRQPDIFWKDMGAIKDQSGILIGFNLDATTVQEAGFNASIAGSATDGTGVCGYLQRELPNGLTGDQNTQYGIGTKQKIVTYAPPIDPSGNTDKQDKEFYAYDYNTYRWYYLGKIADTGLSDAKLVQNTTGTISDLLNNLNVSGLLFKWYQTEYSDTAIPSYWDRTYTDWA